MDILVYDGSLEGLLCCVYEKYERRLKKVKVVDEARWIPSAFENTVHVSSQPDKAKRVWAGLKKELSSDALTDFYRCYLSELEDISQMLLDFASYIFDNPVEEVEKNYGHPVVLQVAQISRKVGREKHRFEAFVRFKATADGMYFATVEPDFNVLPLIIKHFKNRYADQQWVIYDLKRNYGIFYNLKEVSPVTFDTQELKDRLKQENITLDDKEKQFQELWKTYFKSTNIESRKNTKLHLQYLPKRYWKYLTEKLIVNHS